MQARVRSASSLIWRSFLWGRELLEKGLRWRVGDGCSISVYRDRWIPKPSTFRLTSCPNLHAEAMVRELISDSGSWNEQLIGNSFNADDAAAILGLPLSMQRQRDIQIWHFNANGAYSVKSGYWLAENSILRPGGSSSSSLTDWWRFLWKIHLPPKIKIFL
ncbi:hypothetical protein ACOSQ3_031800 [Xanthoceras sorbifolium]